MVKEEKFNSNECITIMNEKVEKIHKMNPEQHKVPFFIEIFDIIKEYPYLMKNLKFYNQIFRILRGCKKTNCACCIDKVNFYENYFKDPLMTDFGL